MGSLTYPNVIADSYKKLTFLDDDNYLSNDDGTNDVNIPEVNFNRISTETSNVDPISLTVKDGFKVVSADLLESSGSEVLTLGFGSNPSYFTVGSDALMDKFEIGDSIFGQWESDDVNDATYRVITAKLDFGYPNLWVLLNRDLNENDLGIEIGVGRTGGLQEGDFSYDFWLYRKNFAVQSITGNLLYNCDSYGTNLMPSLELTGSNLDAGDKGLILARGEHIDYTYIKDSIGRTGSGSFTFLGQSLQDTTNYGSWIEIEVNGSTKLIRTYDTIESPP